MSRPILLDLFCGAGGAAMGYYRAGFDIVGVDIQPQPHYPFPFIQTDALTYPLEGYDVAHASAPCQAFTKLNRAYPNRMPRWGNLIDATRQRLQASGLPYIIENVPGAPLCNPITLCGTSFGIPVRRHRIFESNMTLSGKRCEHSRFTERRFPGSSNRPNGRTVCNIGEYRVPLAIQKECMGVDWHVTLHELSEAIPPAYTEWLGAQLRTLIGKAA